MNCANYYGENGYGEVLSTAGGVTVTQWCSPALHNHKKSAAGASWEPGLIPLPPTLTLSLPFHSTDKPQSNAGLAHARPASWRAAIALSSMACLLLANSWTGL